ncbi:hypothetical protein [Cypionkella sp.]|uniref:hypothetical protein n=1 Tax=Cypionkella sp. TaxID=2811411 RepID=UPI002716A29A|nr:hypothetical protein [Cypionkella sp.]MDO8983771.1 hypothetical protein [Cypionkella sp.]MDP1577157.1 hypothetical protein [Cypionkella sp.]MDP2051671.1 hypothetical protein [Cypionkella sp.]
MNDNAERGKRLEGVKAIAAFMGVTDRTVRRWCCGRLVAGVPILKAGGRYFAFEADLRAWVAR